MADNKSENNLDNELNNGPETAHKTESPPPSSEESLKAEAEKYKHDFLYLRAEFENYKRNAIKERSELLKYGSERVLNDLLGVLDNFERALESKISADNFLNYQKGVEMTATELKSVLQKFGVSEVSALGKPFDPYSHEALSSEESSEVPEGHVLRVFKKAYKLHDKMIRPAQVIVAKQSKN